MKSTARVLKSAFGIVLACALAASQSANACTVLLVKDTVGNAYKGRTLEFPMQIPTELTYYPAGTSVVSKTPDGEKGMSFDTRFAMIAMTFAAVPGAELPTIVDGANDQGLTISANEQSGTMLAPVGTDNSKIMSAADFATWVLGNFRTVDEVKSAVADVEFWLPIVPIVGNEALPLHYAVFDKSGAGIVVEFLDGKVSVHDNPVGVLTNGPAFSWHLTNLNNYTMTNVDENSGQLGNLKLETPDAGIALSSLPSAETAMGRFVKAAFYATYVRKASTPDDQVTTLSHIMNNFDRPYDLTVDIDTTGGDGGSSKGTSSEVTDWTVMNDLSRNLYFVRSINSRNWSVVDLNKLKDVKTSKSLSSYAVGTLGIDATEFFLK